MAIDERNQIEKYRPTPFPEDFGERLEGLRELTGLSWGEFAKLLGVTQRGLLKWRRGGPPSGLYFWTIMEMARDIPGGFELMMDGDGVEELRDLKPESTEGGRRVSVLKWPKGAPLNLG